MSTASSQRVDWLKILLGLGLTGAALYLWSRYASAAPQEPSGEAKGKSPAVQPGGSYASPDNPTHEIFVPGGATMPSSSSSLPAPGPGQVGLRSGKKYRARLQLSGIEKMGSREQIAATFAELGFSGVVVYMSRQELPAAGYGWPDATSLDSGARWAEGVWAKADENIDRPKQVVEVKEV